MTVKAKISLMTVAWSAMLIASIASIEPVLALGYGR